MKIPQSDCSGGTEIDSRAQVYNQIPGTLSTERQSLSHSHHKITDTPTNTLKKKS